MRTKLKAEMDPGALPFSDLKGEELDGYKFLS